MTPTKRPMYAITLKPGRERSVRNRHPWLFSGAIQSAQAGIPDGAPVDVFASNGVWQARGTWSGVSQIRVRLWTWNIDEEIDDTLITRRIRRALASRADLMADPRTNAYRLIFSESDGLPGLIVDSYAGYLVVQLSTVGAAARVDTIVTCLRDELQPQGIYERSDADVRTREGLEQREGPLWGDCPEQPITIVESGFEMLVEIRSGQKTGAYLDQRWNRERVAQYCTGADVLSCFSYTGGFELHAARAGASQITSIDSSQSALALGSTLFRRNGFDVPLEQIAGNVFSELREFRTADRRFDVIILDPPKLASNAAQVEKACRAYKDINLLAMQLLRPGGILATFSCSGLVSADLFQKVVFGASVDAARDVQILERLSQGTDHPILLSFPESEYLKGLICRVW